MALRNDTDIVDMLREGQEEGYRYLFQRHYAPLCAIAYEYVRDDFVAETIVADVFFHVWQIRQRLIVHTSLRNYLAVGVRRHCLDWLRERQHRPLVPATEAMTEQAADDSYPLVRLLDGELEEVVRKAVDTLPCDCRRVFAMSRYDGKKNNEIAQELGISVNTVKYHLKNALRLLRANLRQYLEALFFLFISQQ